MVESLIHSLIEGKAKVSNVSANTQIFKEGELGASPSGGQLSTYKELCSLASDLNQPDLVYKFMNLANHNAVWNSRTAAAFGFGNLATQAGVELEKHLPAIVPKLYRYTFDPQPSIRNPMYNIWSSLVKDTKKTTEQHYPLILSELITTLTNYEWRVRESSCAALADLIRQHTLVPAMSRLAEIWTILFRVADDFKESVRKAANMTLQTLSKCCVKVSVYFGSEAYLDKSIIDDFKVAIYITVKVAILITVKVAILITVKVAIHITVKVAIHIRLL